MRDHRERSSPTRARAWADATEIYIRASGLRAQGARAAADELIRSSGLPDDRLPLEEFRRLATPWVDRRERELLELSPDTTTTSGAEDEPRSNSPDDLGFGRAREPGEDG